MKVSQQTKSWTRWLHCWIWPNIQRKINTNTLNTILKKKKKNYKKGEHSQTHLMRPALLVPKPDKDFRRKETHKPEYRRKNLKQNISNQVQQYIKSAIHCDQVGFFPQGCKDGLTFTNKTMCYTTLTRCRIKVIWLSKQIQRKYLLKFDIHLC